MTTDHTLSKTDEFVIRVFEGTMNFFSRLVNPQESKTVTAADLQASFNHLRTIAPDIAEEMISSFRYTVGEPNSKAICPSELPANHRENLMFRTEAAIRRAESGFSVQHNRPR